MVTASNTLAVGIKSIADEIEGASSTRVLHLTDFGRIQHEARLPRGDWLEAPSHSTGMSMIYRTLFYNADWEESRDSNEYSFTHFNI